MSHQKKRTGVLSKAAKIVMTVLLCVGVCCSFGSAGADSFVTLTQDDISPAKAQEIALKNAGGGVVVKWELDLEDGNKVYEIGVVNGDTYYRLDVDALNGKIHRHRRRGKHHNHHENITFRCTPERAQAIAQKRANGGTVIGWELDRERHYGRVHEIDIVRDGVRCRVAVRDSDGKVVRFKEYLSDW